MIYGFSFAFFVFQYDPEECDVDNVNDDGTTEDGDAPFCTLTDATLTTLTFFYSGPDRTDTWWLDLLFGLMAVVVLLNVVIAIVSDAWADTQEEAVQAFWRYRINYLIDNSAMVTQYGALNDCVTKICGGRVDESMGKWLQDDGRYSVPVTRWLLSFYSVPKPKDSNVGEGNNNEEGSQDGGTAAMEDSHTGKDEDSEEEDNHASLTAKVDQLQTTIELLLKRLEAEKLES